MGGPGSGNRWRWNSKETTESQRRIDIRWLKKNGYLQAGTMGILSWSRRDKQTGAVGFRIEECQLILNYRHRSYDRDWEPVVQSVSFDHTSCNYGGYREWFLCPRCLKRVAILYGAGKYFFCRHCYDLSYSSQQEGPIDRIGRKARKARAKIGASTDLFAPVRCSIPKGMHQKTFKRLKKTADDATKHFWLVMGQWLEIVIK